MYFSFFFFAFVLRLKLVCFLVASSKGQPLFMPERLLYFNSEILSYSPINSLFLWFLGILEIFFFIAGYIVAVIRRLINLSRILIKMVWRLDILVGHFSEVFT